MRGVGAPTSTVIPGLYGKGAAIASQLVPGKTLAEEGLNAVRAKNLMQGHAADVLTANWDAIGKEQDNVILKPNPIFAEGGQTPIRIDQGGAFLRRASGALKPAGGLNEIGEIESLCR